jgi:hypothetical protein
MNLSQISIFLANSYCIVYTSFKDWLSLELFGGPLPGAFSSRYFHFDSCLKDKKRPLSFRSAPRPSPIGNDGISKFLSSIHVVPSSSLLKRFRLKFCQRQPEFQSLKGTTITFSSVRAECPLLKTLTILSNIEFLPPIPTLDPIFQSHPTTK